MTPLATRTSGGPPTKQKHVSKQSAREGECYHHQHHSGNHRQGFTHCAVLLALSSCCLPVQILGPRALQRLSRLLKAPIKRCAGAALVPIAAVAPSDPDVIYVGSGEADMRSDISFGDGVYKSTDGGKTWTHLGLRDTRQIGRILVDPKDANIVLVAALAHGFGPNLERGVFRSTDGGQSWTKVLYKNAEVGAIELAFDPENSRTVYAALWNTRRPPWSVYAPITGPGGGLYRSTDGGVTWNELTGHGLPAGKLGRIGIDVAAGQKGKRVYAMIDAERNSGLYRSDDSGGNWQLVSSEPRITGRAWYFSEVRIDPRNPDLVYVSNVSLYRSTDG